MTKTFKFQIAILAVWLPLLLNAQSWSLSGNQATTSSNFIGTTDSKDLKIKTNNLTRLTIKNNGNVGIGVSSPSEKFAVKSVDNLNTTYIASFKSNNGFLGIAISQNTISAIGSASGDLNLKPTTGNNAKVKIVDAEIATVSSSGNYFGGFGPRGIPPKDGGHFYMNTTGNGPVVADFSLAETTDSAVVRATVPAMGNTDYAGFHSSSFPANGYGVGFESRAGYIGIRCLTYLPNATDQTYGGYISVTGVGSGVRYGVYASASGSTTSNWAFFGVGSSFASGGQWQASDQRLKKEMKPLENVTAKIMKLKPVNYNFKTEEYKFMNLPQETQFGFLAQDMETVFPEMVKDIQMPLLDKEGNPTRANFTFRGVNYEQLIAVLVGAMQEQNKSIEQLKADAHQASKEKNDIIEQQQKQIVRLQTKMNQFENDLMQCCSNAKSANIEYPVSINKNDLPLIEQNAPNPFNENAVIKYYLPLSVKLAEIKLTAINGESSKTFNLGQRGFNEVIISGNTLAAGSYIYYLIVDGKTIDSKLMTLTK